MPPIQNSFDASLNTLSTSVNCFLVAMSTGVSPCMFFFFDTISVERARGQLSYVLVALEVVGALAQQQCDQLRVVVTGREVQRRVALGVAKNKHTQNQ